MDGDPEPSDNSLRSARIIEYRDPVDGALAAPHKVYLDPTLVCPCSCNFCSARVKAAREFAKITRTKIPKLDTIDSATIVEEIINSGAVLTKIAGGEPFTWRPLWKAVEKLGEAGIGLSMSTSGYNLPEIAREKIELLKTYGMKISVSIDGPEDYHDQNRGYAGLYKKATRGIQRLLALGYPKDKVEIRATIANTNKAIENAFHITHMAELSGLRTRIRMARPTGDALATGRSHVEPNDGYWNLFNILRGLKKYPLLNFDDPVNFDDDPEQMVLHAGLDCGAGSRQLTINARGEAMPCAYLEPQFAPVSVLAARKKGRTLLDIWQGNDATDSFNNVRVFHQRRARMLPCTDCVYKHGCQGGCPTYGLTQSQDLQHPVPDPRCPVVFAQQGGWIRPVQ